MFFLRECFQVRGCCFWLVFSRDTWTPCYLFLFREPIQNTGRRFHDRWDSIRTDGLCCCFLFSFYDQRTRGNDGTQVYLVAGCRPIPRTGKVGFSLDIRRTGNRSWFYDAQFCEFLMYTACGLFQVGVLPNTNRVLVQVCFIVVLPVRADEIAAWFLIAEIKGTVFSGRACGGYIV